MTRRRITLHYRLRDEAGFADGEELAVHLRIHRGRVTVYLIAARALTGLIAKLPHPPEGLPPGSAA